MAIKLLSKSPLTENAALFENDKIQGQDQGAISWGEVTEEEGVYYVTIQGFDVKGDEIEPTETTTEDEADTVNPTKVFWWVAKTLKTVLCPECL